MSQITCHGLDGVDRIFDVNHELNLDGNWEFTATTADLPSGIEPFTLTLFEKADGTLQVIWIGSADRVYPAMGVVLPLLTLATDLLGKPIVSSQAQRAAGEFRTPFVEKMWQRFVANGHATYDRALDMYTFVP